MPFNKQAKHIEWKCEVNRHISEYSARNLMKFYHFTIKSHVIRLILNEIYIHFYATSSHSLALHFDPKSNRCHKHKILFHFMSWENHLNLFIPFPSLFKYFIHLFLHLFALKIIKNHDSCKPLPLPCHVSNKHPQMFFLVKCHVEIVEWV